MSARAPLAVCLAVALLLLPLALIGGGSNGEQPAAAPPPTERTASLATIAARVERLRGLRFERTPRAQPVTPAQARREGLEDLDRSYPEARRRADEETLKLLGLIAPDVDLRKVTASVFGEDVAGYYDPRSDRLRIVRGAATSSRVLAEMTLAHELTHALEDQRFRLRTDELDETDDASLAYLALVEGSATAVMFEYVDRHFSAGQALEGLLPALSQGSTGLPPFLEAQLVFPYTSGKTFVEELYRDAGDRWTLVDAAHRLRAPASTEQIMHPLAYLRDERPRRVRFAAAERLGAGWRRVAGGTLGEFQTGQLIGGSAAGWGGDRYELWRAGALDPRTCRAPCTARDALVARWVWDDRAGLRDFAGRLRGYVTGTLAARPAGSDVWTRGGGAVAVAARAGSVTLALAPTTALAQRLAGAHLKLARR